MPVEITDDQALAILEEPEFREEYGSEQGQLSPSYKGSYCRFCRAQSTTEHKPDCLRLKLQGDQRLRGIIERRQWQADYRELVARRDVREQQLDEAKVALQQHLQGKPN